MLRSIDSCQNRVSTDQYHLTISLAQVSLPLTLRVFWRYPVISYKFSIDRKLKYKWISLPCYNFIVWSKNCGFGKVDVWRPVLVKIMTIKLHHKSILIQLQQILWTCCVFLSSLNNTFFSVLVIIFSNKSYFCFNYTNTFFYHAMHYFLVVLRIIFPVCIKNYFLIELRIIFRGIANLFFGLQCIAGLAFEVDWFESLTSLGDHFENFEVEECFERECQGETLSGKETKEVFILLTKSIRSQ